MGETKERPSFQEQLQFDLNAQRRKLLAMEFRSEAQNLQKTKAFIDLYKKFFERNRTGSAPPNVKVPRNIFAVITLIAPTRQVITENLTQEPRQIKTVTLDDKPRIQIEGMTLTFDPEKMLAAWLTGDKSKPGTIIINYPHLDQAGKIATKTEITLQANTMRVVVLKAMEAAVKDFPLKRKMPKAEQLETKHYGWMASRFNQIDELADLIPLTDEEKKPLRTMPIGAILNAAWEPTSPKSREAFNQMYSAFSKPPFSILLDYLDVTETKYSPKS